MSKQPRSISPQKTAQVIQLDTFASTRANFAETKPCLPQGHQSTNLKQAPQQPGTPDWSSLQV